jgi:hypothetical protein
MSTMQSSEEIGLAFREIINRIKNTNFDEVKEPIKWGCHYCKNYTREEGYNQQWGMYQFYNCYCNKGIKDEYIINDGKQSNCSEFEEGENNLVYMSDKEKRRIEGRM